MKRFWKLTMLSLAVISVSAQAQEQRRPAFPQEDGLNICYRYLDEKGTHYADSRISLRNVHGDMNNGGLDMAYICMDKDGKPYLDGNNECLMNVDRISGQTYITMDKMSKVMKIMDLITAGDVSTIKVPMTVGETLPDSQIFTTLGILKATLTISDKKVLDHKFISVDGHEYECWLVHEKIVTKTPFSTDTDIADTWYAEGVGCIIQNVYNTKGKLKRTLELTSIYCD